MGQAKRKQLAGYQPPQLPKVYYKGRLLSPNKTRWLIENYPDQLRRMD